MHAPLIKFCGLTRREDIDTAVALGVDCIGLVFATRSPRRLDLDTARALRDAVPASVRLVALTMDNTADEVADIVAAVRPDVLQFHGAEADAFCRGFGLPYWKAIAMGGDPSAALRTLHAWPCAEAFLFDGHAAGEPGGSGARFDWSALPARLDRPFWLAGGLDAGNVAQAVTTAHPAGVDVSSGIEAAPGIKDAARMRAFVAALQDR
ncbi:N-(5'-phosphoribosyl)anthranilate isomerase [Lysobacteraceae bacterium NML93-0399]|nr:N-(5'-phosphoribosyl)anthranilate isomerase [Xanthomonadaceae bacterium NML93-0399]